MAAPVSWAMVGLVIDHSWPLVAIWICRWRWMMSSMGRPRPPSNRPLAIRVTSAPAQNAPPAPVSTTQPTSSSFSNWESNRAARRARAR